MNQSEADVGYLAHQSGRRAGTSAPSRPSAHTTMKNAEQVLTPVFFVEPVRFLSISPAKPKPTLHSLI